MLTTLLDAPFYTGKQVSNDVPGKFPVAIAGHPYLVDLMSDQTGLRGQYFRRMSVPVLRTQADNSNVPEESSINPDDMWRRSQKSWHMGAGQTHLDWQESDSNRFRSSKGVNVWTKNQATLLPDTTKILTSANSVRAVMVGTYLYLIDGQALKYSANPTAASPSFTTVTGTPVATASAITTDGFTVYVAYPGGLYTTTRGAATATAAGDTNPYTTLGYCNGRLMAAYQNKVYNITSLAAPTAALYTHPNSDFTWVGFTGQGGFIFCAGYSGDKTIIYQTAVKSDGTALTIPAASGTLPDGEIVRSVLGYAGFVVIGSDIGVRLGNPDSSGNLTVGGLVNTGTSVLCLAAYNRFVWFGWTNYDATSTGLGRIDLSAFTTNDIPAYATDLMASAQGVVGTLVMASGTPIFGVDTVGVYNQSANLVASGSIDSGLLTYDLADPKTAMFANTKCAALPAGATLVTLLSADGGTFVNIGTVSVTGATGPAADYPAGQVMADTFELRETLTYATDHTQGPTLTRHTLRVYPTPARSFEWTIPLLIHEQIQPYGDMPYPLVVTDEISFLFGLLNTLVTLQVGGTSYQVFVEDVEQLPWQVTADKSAFASTVIIHGKEPGV